MQLEGLLWLFPVIFMIHEMEEIVGLRIWLDRNSDIVKDYNILSNLYQNYSNEGFSLAVLEEYFICIIITALSIFYKFYIAWIGVSVAFTLHLVIHIIQSMIVKRYIPALISSMSLLPLSIFLIYKVISMLRYTTYSLLVSSMVSVILMMVNLIMIHWMMKKITENLKNTLEEDKLIKQI
ncbi:MAG: HXXEE domain-containing protein [Filifactoraceae bacterium]